VETLSSAAIILRSGALRSRFRSDRDWVMKTNRRNAIEKERSLKKKWMSALTVGVLCLAAATAIVGGILDDWRKPTRELWNKVSIGDSEESVRAALGAPYCEYEAESALSDYYIGGYGRGQRAVTGKVLIYQGEYMIFYVWIAREGKVEDRFVGTS